MSNNRVWIYLSETVFDEQLELGLKTDIQNFLLGWNAHGKALASDFEIKHNHFIIIKVNEEDYSASGCSIDKQLQFIKEIEKKYDISLLNRLLVAYKKANEVMVIHSSKISQLLADRLINENTLVFNIALSTEGELTNDFEKLLKETWLSKYLVKQLHD